MSTDHTPSTELPFLQRVLFRDEQGKVGMGQVVHNMGGRSDGTPLGRQHRFDLSAGLQGDPAQWCPVPALDATGWKTNPRFSAPHEVDVLAISQKTGHAWLEANGGPLSFPGFMGRFERFQGATHWMEIEQAVELAGGWRNVPAELLAGEDRDVIRFREAREWAHTQANALALAVINDAGDHHRYWSPMVEGDKVTHHRHKIGLDDWLRKPEDDRDGRRGMLLAWTEGHLEGFLKSNPDAIDRDDENRDHYLMRKLAAQQLLDHYGASRSEYLAARRGQEALRHIDLSSQQAPSPQASLRL